MCYGGDIGRITLGWKAVILQRNEKLKQFEWYVTIPMALRVVSSSPAIFSSQRRAASVLPSTLTLPNTNSSLLSSSSSISSFHKTKSVTLRSNTSRRNGVVTCSASVLPKALLFDCDGVLVDTEKDGHRISFNDTFAEVHFLISHFFAGKGSLGTGKVDQEVTTLEVVSCSRADVRPFSGPVHIVGAPDLPFTSIYFMHRD